MGVLGLWQILESIGHPIKIEALEGKRLGVDANVWLYKFIRGFRDKDNGSSNLDSHKLGLFNRISKLLFYKIKPVFVFDGPAPALKRRTLERRQNVRNKQLTKVQDAAMKLLAEQLKKQYPDANIDQLTIKLPELRSNNLVAAEKLTDEDRELFYLPPETIDDNTDEDDEDEDDLMLDRKPTTQEVKQEGGVVYHVDTDDENELQGSVDIESKDFANLPAEVRYEILTDIRESRRRIRRAEALPDDAGSFSSLQMERLRARRLVQEKIEQCEKDICSMYTIGDSIQSYRVQSDPNSTMLYLKNSALKQSSPPPAQSEQARSSDKPRLSSSQPVQSTSATHKLSGNLVAAAKPVDEHRELPRLSPEKVDSNAERDDITDDVRIETPVKKEHSVYYIDDSDESESQGSDDTDSNDFTEVPPVSPPVVQTSTQSSPTECSDKPSSPMNKTIELTSDTLELSDEHEELEEQHSDANTDQLTIKLPEPRLNNLVASEKLTDEDRELFYLPSETIDDNADDDEKEDDLVLPREPTTHEVQREDGVVYLVDTDDDENEPQGDSIQSNQVQSDSNSTMLDPKNSALKQSSPLPAQPSAAQSAPKESSPPPAQPSAAQSAPKESSPPPAQPSTNQSAPGRSSDKPRLSSSQPVQSTSEARVMREQLVSAQSDARLATNRVTGKIVAEAQELLRLFGIPYIVAAGEAEAQCALLEKLNLTDGTITDDSDVWLFGAQNVYRYFFSDDKYVMHYKMTDIEYHIRMTRENLVCFAMLVGSDYTDGIMKVGPVTALEILSEFQGEGMEPLMRFKSWKDKYEASKGRTPGSKKREKLLKYRLPDEFPSRNVFDGYMRPMADSCEDKFSWGTPELDELREYARRHFGWDPKKIDDKLLPVMKKLNERRTQTTIDSFFFKTAANQNPELFRSKRINAALDKIAKTSSSQDVVNLSEDEEGESGSADDGTTTTATKAPVPRVKKSNTTTKGRAATKKKSPQDNGTRKRRKVRGK